MLKTKHLIIALALCASSLLVAADETAEKLRQRVRIGDGSGYSTVASELYGVWDAKQGTLSGEQPYGKALVFTKMEKSFRHYGLFNDMDASTFKRFFKKTQGKHDFIHFTLQDTGNDELDGSTLAVIYNTYDVNDAPRLEALLAAEVAAKKMAAQAAA